jgi:hypothetical protein
MAAFATVEIDRRHPPAVLTRAFSQGLGHGVHDLLCFIEYLRRSGDLRVSLIEGGFIGHDALYSALSIIHSYVNFSAANIFKSTVFFVQDAETAKGAVMN